MADEEDTLLGFEYLMPENLFVAFLESESIDFYGDCAKSLYPIVHAILYPNSTDHGNPYPFFKSMNNKNFPSYFLYFDI